MSDPASFVYLPEQVREMDRIAITDLGIPGYELMSRAGQVVFDLVCQRYGTAGRWLVLCGAGNNAGDGYVIARLARAAGIAVVVAALSEPRRLRGDAARAWEAFCRDGGEVVQFSETMCTGVDVVIDAMLGTGLERAIEGAYLHAVERVNAAPVAVVAVDMPTGLCARSGQVLGAAIEADITVTFIGRKLGLYVGVGPDYAGDIVFSDLGVPVAQVSHVLPAARLVATADLARCLPRRARSAHKGHFGHVLVVGSNEGMGGAGRLAGEAALRSGAGLVTVATRPANVAAIVAGRPELMCRGVNNSDELGALLERATVVAVGPGLGQDAWAHAMWNRASGSARPLVVDADALNLLAEAPRVQSSWVLTPHPGEAARLLGSSVDAIQADRLAAVSALWEQYGGVVVLKGRCTVVGCRGELPYLVDAGNPGMASAGMGDVLTGIVAGLVAQSRARDLLLTTACAAFVHARAADEVARTGGERGLIAGDLLVRLRPWLNPRR